jgi:hypothetical protein
MIDDSAPDVVCGVEGAPLSCSLTSGVPAETVSVDSVSRILLVDTTVEFESHSHIPFIEVEAVGARRLPNKVRRSACKLLWDVLVPLAATCVSFVKLIRLV